MVSPLVYYNSPSRSRVALRHVARHLVPARSAHPARTSSAQAQPLQRAQSV